MTDTNTDDILDTNTNELKELIDLDGIYKYFKGHQLDIMGDSIYCINNIPFVIFQEDGVNYFAYIKWLPCDKMKTIYKKTGNVRYYDNFTYKYYKKRIINVDNYKTIYHEIVEMAKKTNDCLREFNSASVNDARYFKVIFLCVFILRR